MSTPDYAFERTYQDGMRVYSFSEFEQLGIAHPINGTIMQPPALWFEVMERYLAAHFAAQPAPPGVSTEGAAWAMEGER